MATFVILKLGDTWRILFFHRHLNSWYPYSLVGSCYFMPGQQTQGQQTCYFSSNRSEVVPVFISHWNCIGAIPGYHFSHRGHITRPIPFQTLREYKVITSLKYLPHLFDYCSSSCVLLAVLSSVMLKCQLVDRSCASCLSWPWKVSICQSPPTATCPAPSALAPQPPLPECCRRLLLSAHCSRRRQCDTPPPPNHCNS